MQSDWRQSPELVENWVSHIRSTRHLNQGFFQVDLGAGDWSELPDYEQRLERHKAWGFGVEAGTILELFDGEIITLEFARRLDEPRYDDAVLSSLNSIDAAFRQSVLFASRLQFERARGAVELFNDIGLPAALLTGNGQIVYTNALFEGVGRYMSRSPSGRITISGNDTLRKTFAHALELSARKSVDVAIPADGDRHPAVIQLMPICGDARSIFSMPCTIMVVTPVATTAGVPSAELVSDLFGLTKMEARLATALASGLSVRDSAANLDITIGTARSYLIRIFSKTATGQQSELVSLIKGIPTKAAE